MKQSELGRGIGPYFLKLFGMVCNPTVQVGDLMDEGLERTWAAVIHNWMDEELHVYLFFLIQKKDCK